jgi:hypothetical protein
MTRLWMQGLLSARGIPMTCRSPWKNPRAVRRGSQAWLRLWGCHPRIGGSNPFPAYSGKVTHRWPRPAVRFFVKPLLTTSVSVARCLHRVVSPSLAISDWKPPNPSNFEQVGPIGWVSIWVSLSESRIPPGRTWVSTLEPFLCRIPGSFDIVNAIRQVTQSRAN